MNAGALVSSTAGLSSKAHRLPIGPVAALLGLMASQPILADSAIIAWMNGGQLHRYQRIDVAGVTWDNAKKACEVLVPPAHLATITSPAEQDFIERLVLQGNESKHFWLGGSDPTIDNTFTWVTGEGFAAYSHWSTIYVEPDQVGFGPITILNMNLAYDYPSFWHDMPTTYSTGGYICEWELDNYVGTATVRDLNANGSTEIAALYVDFPSLAHTVKIKDGTTGAAVGVALTYQTSDRPPRGLAVLNDLNANGSPEVAVLYLVGAQPTVWIKDTKTGLSVGSKILFLNQGFEPTGITVRPDSDGNKAQELTVVGVSKTTGKATAETRDSKTGTKIGTSILF